MVYEDLINAHKNYETKFDFDKVYKKLIQPIKDPWADLDSIIEFVRKWNRRVPIGRNKEKIKEVVLSLSKKFGILKNYNIENFEFNQKNIEIVKIIYQKLSETVLRNTGTTKIMHAINTINKNLFIMWDKGICQHYGYYQNSTGYIHFMKEMQENAQKIIKEHNKSDIITKTGITLPKLLDEYNWINYRTSKSL